MIPDTQITPEVQELLNSREQNYQDLMQKAKDWAADGYHGRARSYRLSAARLLGKHTKADWAAMKSAVAGVCPRCDEQSHHFDKDHIIPIYAGGSDGLDNIQPLCAPCNAQKGPEAINWFKARGHSI